MADVERGQLVLLTALVIAIGLAALTVLLNMAIFTENLASRGTDTGAADALEYRQVSAETVRDLLTEENEEHHPSHDAVFTNVSNGTERYEEITAIRYARTNIVADLSNIEYHNGSKLGQNQSSRDFVDNAQAENNWTLVEDVHNTRKFSVTVTSVNETTDPGDEAFEIRLDSTDDWSLFIYNDTSQPRLRVNNGTGGLSGEICNSALPANPPFTVNLTAGTVDGTSCSAIEFAKGISAPYHVKFRWGNRSEGTYNLTVNSTTGLSNFDSYQQGQPYQFPIVYSAAFDVTYRNDQLHYRDRVRVVAGEPV